MLVIKDGKKVARTMKDPKNKRLNQSNQLGHYIKRERVKKAITIIFDLLI